MRILYLIDSLGPGGAERSLAAMAPLYTRKGIELEVAFLHDRAGVRPDLEAAGAGLFSLAGRGGRAGWTRRVHRLLASRRPDLLHTTLFEADVTGRVGATLTGVPVVSSLVNVAYGADQAATPGVRRWKVRGAQLADALTARRVVRFHANASHIADVMAGRLRVPRDRIEVIPRGRDPELLGRRDPARRARARAGLGVSGDSPLLLAVARHEHQKGLDVLLEALPAVLARAPGARLLVAGRQGNQTPLLRAAADQLRLDGAATFLGARSDVADLLCAADVLVIPSRWEGLSNVLIEAMALEAPVVASDLPTLHDAVDDGDTARLVPSGDPARLAAAIVANLEDPAAAAARAARARQRFLDRFTIDRVVDRMLAFYGHALAAGPRRSRATAP
ncbi:MAG TPA: glycosyltransferase family 4 protein [Actinomycetes bacterium]|nr:glycosyltransferase family 4 protein [Actinomycetes bacterium]